MLGNEVILDIDELSICVDPFERVAAVAMVEAPSLGCTVITEEHESGVISLWGVGEQIEESIVVQKEVGWVAILGADDIWSLDRITAEEHRLDRG